MARIFSAKDAKAVSKKYDALADRVLSVASRLSAEAKDAREAITAMASSTILEEVLQDELYEQNIGKTLNYRLIPVMKHAFFLVHWDSVKSNSDLLVVKKESIRAFFFILIDL